MNIDQKRVDELVSRPSETLNVEVKRWIDPDAPSGIAKIVRAALALRNRNGGYLVVGFDDKTLQPDLGNEPRDVRAAFHTDKIQGHISRHASELFEVDVAFGKRDGREYPVIAVPEGVRTPVAVKADLMDGTSKLVQYGGVYFRTLSANGTPSTALAKPGDWREIVEICFENREADIGRFLRRQLGSRDAASLVEVLKLPGMTGTDADTRSEILKFIESKVAGPRPRVLQQRATELLREGEERFRRAIAGRKLKTEEQAVADAGSFSVALVVDPPRSDALPDQSFLSTIGSSNPQYTGWPYWLNSSRSSDERNRPKVTEKTWEALIVSLDGWSKHVDLLRFDPKGEFYHRRNLADDVKERIKPQTVLDPIIVIIRVAEAIAAGLSIIKALGWDPEKTRLGFAFSLDKA